MANKEVWIPMLTTPCPPSPRWLQHAILPVELPRRLLHTPRDPFCSQHPPGLFLVSFLAVIVMDTVPVV
jgi:hypothetical protein